MNNPLVTIAIPAYKADFIEQTIESALNQSYPNTEVIIVDDSPGQRIREIACRYAGDRRLTYYKNQANLGKDDPARNWNECLRHAHGEYICILCDDDSYGDDFVSTLMSLAERYPDCHALRSGVSEIDAQGHVTSLFPLAPEHMDIAEYIWHLHSRKNHQTMSEWMLRTRRLRDMGGYANHPMAWGADCATVFAMAEEGGVASSPLRLMSFRNSGRNITGRSYSHVPEKIRGWNMQCDKARSIISRSDSPYKNVIIKEIERDRRTEHKFLVKHASIGDLNRMMREPETYGISTALYVKGIIRNILWMTGLKRKR